MLPQIVPFLASTVSSNGAFFAEFSSSTQKKRVSEGDVIIHKLKTQLSAFLQDGRKEARWAAVVLIKAMFEVGGWGLLQDSGHWVRALLGLIGRPEPSTTKKLGIITLTRFFLLTNGNQSLVREITTPSLPTFISGCVKVSKDGKSKSAQYINAHDSVLSTILWAFGKLIPQHPKIFKPFIDQIRTIVLPLIAATPSTLQLGTTEHQSTLTSISETVAQRARHVFVLLNFRGPIAASSQEWERSLSFLIEKTHATADVVFRGFTEDQEPDIRIGSINRNSASLAGTCQWTEDDSDWPAWTGVCAGLERLNSQLLVIQSFLQYPTPVPVAVHVSKILVLIDRILALLPPSEKGSRSSNPGTPTKPELLRDEREAVWAWLPHLHISALKLAEQLIRRLGECSMSLNQQLLDNVVCVFEYEHSYVDIREAVYRILPPLLAHCASRLHRSLASPIAACLKVCCDDLIPAQADADHTQGKDISTGMTSNKSGMNADAYLKNPDKSLISDKSSSLQDLAALLLSAALAHLPRAFLSFSVRSKIDRSAVLAQNELLMQVSVLNAAARRGRKQQSSLLPLLSRHFPESHNTEALIRPRLPPLQPHPANLSDGDSDTEAIATEGREEDINRILTEDPDASMERSSPAITELVGHEMTEIARPEIQVQPSELQPLSSTHGTIEQGQEIKTSAKRLREAGSGDMDLTVSDESKHLLAPDGEPKRKRMRDDGDGIHVSPATEDDSPPPIAPFPSDTPHPSSAEIRHDEPLAKLRKVNEDLADDDSDDSSIPPIDPTPDTEDDYSDDDDGAD
ncbi:MAG: hypothetical protein Q9216_006404 [Gyalolechia sp. 2 TL-2023]